MSLQRKFSYLLAKRFPPSPKSGAEGDKAITAARRPAMDNRGVALIVVLMIVTTMVALTVGFNRSTREELFDTANLSDGIRLHYIAKSGFNGAEAILMQDKNNYDALTEDWAKVEYLSIDREFFSKGGSFRVKIEDESGKIPVSSLVNGNDFNPQIKSILENLLKLPEFNLSQEQAKEIVEAIKERLVKKGLLDCIDDLLMVKGVTRELFYGADGSPALRDALTVYGDGRININTAPKMVLRSLAEGITEDVAEQMDSYRRDEKNNLADVNWYKKIEELKDVNLNPALITVTSSCFTVNSAGIFGNMKENIVGTIWRSPDRKSVRLLSWKLG